MKTEKLQNGDLKLIFVLKLSWFIRIKNKLVKMLFPYTRYRHLLRNKELFVNLNPKNLIQVTEHNISNRIYLGYYQLCHCKNLSGIINITYEEFIASFGVFEKCNGVTDCVAFGSLVKWRIKKDSLYTYHKYKEV